MIDNTIQLVGRIRKITMHEDDGEPFVSLELDSVQSINANGDNRCSRIKRYILHCNGEYMNAMKHQLNLQERISVQGKLCGEGQVYSPLSGVPLDIKCIEVIRIYKIVNGKNMYVTDRPA